MIYISDWKKRMKPRHPPLAPMSPFEEKDDKKDKNNARHFVKV